MARAGTKTFFWTASTATDVATYRVYATEEAAPITYSSPHVDVGLVTEVDLGRLANEGFTPLVDAEGSYNLGVSALDGMGNESDIAVRPSVPLDFVPPAAPTGLGVR
jgi:hypothetical protein